MVEILPYQISWLSDFRLIASCLREGLGNLASRIDHIGSTSVPGLAAKDVIDIQITVANLGQELSMAMVALGYNQRAAPQRDHPPAGFEGDETESTLSVVVPRLPAHASSHSRSLCGIEATISGKSG
jgi:GrpB-like predicted nucleotidyltransferase (UPF0157 family)